MNNLDYVGSVYLGGPIAGVRFGDCNNWRVYAKKELAKHNISGVSPTRFKEIGLDEIASDRGDKILTLPKGLTTRDRYDVQSTDISLFYLIGATRVSIGTMIEYGWADSARKPIITVIEREGNVHEHSFVRELSGFVVETLDEGLYVAKAILLS